MKKERLKSFILYNLVLLLILIAIAAYIHFSYPDFRHLNLENITNIKNNSQESERISFVVLGNINNSISLADNRKMISNINHLSPDFVVSTGNAVMDGAEYKYQILNKSLMKLNCPSLIGVGENEVSDGGLKRFDHHYGETNFSFSLNDSCFIFLDTTTSSDIPWQKQWLQDELENYSALKYKFIFMNKPAYKIQVSSVLKSEPGYIKNKSYQEFLTDIFSQYNVSAVFASNIEGYDSRVIKGVTYCTSGGGGGIMTQDDTFYHFLKIDAYPGYVSSQIVKQGKIPNTGFYHFLETFRIYMLSLLYANLFKILIFLFATSLVSLFIYSRVFIAKDYYKNYDITNISPDIKTPLNIAMFTNNYLPFIGGVPVSISRLSDGIRTLGHNVVVFAPRYPGSQEDTPYVKRCRLLILLKTKAFHFPIVNIFAPYIKREFNRQKFDIVHVHHPFWMGRKGLKLARINNLPVVLTYHTRLEQYAHNLPFFRNLFRNVLSHIIIKRFSQKCDAIIAPTFSAMEYLRNIGVSRHISVLATGVDIERYPANESPGVKALRYEQLENRELLLCSVSRLTKEKNLYFILNGIKYIKDHTRVSFKYLLIGTGPEKANLLCKINELGLNGTVELTGQKTQEEIYMYYAASDLFVFASRSETQGIVLLEAMAAKCPVVSICSSGIDDIIKEGFNGYKTSEDVQKWAEKVIELMENREKRITMGENAFQFAGKHSVKAMSIKALGLYEKIIREKHFK